MVRHRSKSFLPILFCLTAAVVSTGQVAIVTAAGRQQLIETKAEVDRFYRTELYFGMNKPTGGEVTDADWREFLENEVTPRFPDGFTVLEALGQYRGANGVIVRENSRVIVFLYPSKNKKAASEKIEQIRSAYIRLFQQESVLRLDLPKTVKVSF